MKGRLDPAAPAAPLDQLAAAPNGRFVEFGGELCYRISAVNGLDPFLMTLASDSDLWMFVASRGGLAAGRVDAEGSLFPYLTVDQLHDAHHHTGPLTLIRVERGPDADTLWQPFAETGDDDPAVERNLYKNILGNRLVFEEIHHGLALAFRYGWSACDAFGWVRTSALENLGAEPLRVGLLDGLRNILPYGAPLALYQQAGNLVDAYKKSEVDPDTGLGLFSLTAGITDRAEALEVLRANTVWCCGLEQPRIHLSPGVVTAFRRGQLLPRERELNGARGNFFVSCNLDLAAGTSTRWHLAADVGRDQLQIAALRRMLRETPEPAARIRQALREADEALVRSVASADGLQLSDDIETTSHHFANVLFNIMRGGVFDRNNRIPRQDFLAFLQIRNTDVSLRQATLLETLPADFTVEALLETARASGDADFERLCHEYLPLYFGRRHGDPSRPWNRFSIRTRDAQGARLLSYEGNWRDIFQNWEALGTAFPGFLPNFVSKFVNASTVDGFNPYRITRDGVDWETVDEGDPWGNIGYWGDHQIIYLLKLLEGLAAHAPGALDALLGREIFSYAEVPYLIKPYAEILQDARSTIVFDAERAARIETRVAARGTDGKLVTGRDGAVHHVNLFEKLLVPALSKLSNLVPDAGIWMNTQRPEWNDANNALGGGGVSVVTLCYLRRYLAFLAEALAEAAAAELPVSTEVADWFARIRMALDGARAPSVAASPAAVARKRLLDALGTAFSDYREAVYAHGFTGKTGLAVGEVVDFCRSATALLDRGIRANRREDGLYHAYNLLEFSPAGDAVEIVRLPVMLEGQVAAISSGLPDADETKRILAGLFASALYRADQHSFMLYPERTLPGFLDKNVVPEEAALAIPLVRKLLSADDRTLLARDADGRCRFSSALRSDRDLAAALDELERRTEWSAQAATDRQAVLDLFETVFHHKSYTGRSGVMYGYEGLGCIYWHMVAKLLLAVQEVIRRAERDAGPGGAPAALIDGYYRIRAGLGLEKTVVEYGAFPSDPYSHTPAGGGAKQPGMTGQVKEEILTRRGELGVEIRGGSIRFHPFLLRVDELLGDPADFAYIDVMGAARSLPVPAGGAAFTLCQVPVVYRSDAPNARLRVEFSDGSRRELSGDTLGPELSADVFARNGRIRRIQVDVPVGTIRVS